eukprot:TRINITY_DN1370_c0_g1_i1.p1 TRINITY_DN1370_c0_g1~~TRINITY_DN1370_c0_g1_i1.p1  ORF type:complete len:90 (+),score=16.61 TRINITY_DN1370_c0_g1_i1:558-827(+)
MIVDGIPTKDSPTKVHLGNIADTERCSAIEPNLEELVVYARDKNGKSTDGLCTVTLTGPNGPINVKVHEDIMGATMLNNDQLLPESRIM